MMPPAAVFAMPENVPVVLYAVEPVAVTVRSAPAANGQSSVADCAAPNSTNELLKLVTDRAVLGFTPPVTASRCRSPAVGVSELVVYDSGALLFWVAAPDSQVDPADNSQAYHSPEPVAHEKTTDA
jgi:hypothetical protein